MNFSHIGQATSAVTLLLLTLLCLLSACVLQAIHTFLVLGDQYDIPLFLCDTELSQSRGNNVVKSHTRAQPECRILQQYYPEIEIILYHIITGN